jgi:hypothetical protein
MIRNNQRSQVVPETKSTAGGEDMFNVGLALLDNCDADDTVLPIQYR